MVYSETFNGLVVTTGDIICTTDGTNASLLGRAWQMVGLLVPGKIDHAILYIGPNGRCIEAAAKGVIDFVMPNNRWDAEQVAKVRVLYDSLVGIAYPLQGRNLAPPVEAEVRQSVAAFSLEQIGKPYNINFFAPDLDAAFYCSQLVYRAYLEQGIDLLNGQSPTSAPTTPLIVTPQMLWDSCVHQTVS